MRHDWKYKIKHSLIIVQITNMLLFTHTYAHMMHAKCPQKYIQIKFVTLCNIYALHIWMRRCSTWFLFWWKHCGSLWNTDQQTSVIVSGEIDSCFQWHTEIGKHNHSYLINWHWLWHIGCWFGLALSFLDHLYINVLLG